MLNLVRNGALLHGSSRKCSFWFFLIDLNCSAQQLGADNAFSNQATGYPHTISPGDSIDRDSQQATFESPI